MSNLDSNHPTPTLILIHGATINGRMWDGVRRHLDPRYRVLTPDLPGHGTRRGEPLTLDGMVATVVDAARSVAPSPVLLAGDSLGGYTAMAAAAALPRDQLKGLVLGGCTANLSGLALAPFYLKMATFKLLLTFAGEERLIRGLPKKLAELGIDETDIAAMIERGISFPVFSAAVKALRHVDFRAKLAAIEQPVLLVNGSRDRTFVNQEPAFLAVAQHATQHRFADCEHGVSILRSAEFADLINQLGNRVFTA